MKKFLLLLLPFFSFAPLSAEIRELKFGFEGCYTQEKQNEIRLKLSKMDGIQSIRTLKTDTDFAICLSWNPKSVFSSASFYKAFASTEYPLSAIQIVLDGDLVNGSKLLIKSPSDRSLFMIDADEEEKIREESQDLTRFTRCHIEAKILNIREDNFLDVIKCTLY